MNTTEREKFGSCKAGEASSSLPLREGADSFLFSEGMLVLMQ